MAELNEAQEQARKLWASGDYPSAMRVIAGVGPLAVERAAVTSDDMVLDVACGRATRRSQPRRPERGRPDSI